MTQPLSEVPMVQVGDLWVPTIEEKRFSNYPMKDGIPDLDVSKIYNAVPSCRHLRVAIDVGAHIGATSIAMARHFERVESFEVLPETFAVLARNAADQSKITLHNTAIADEPGELRFEYLRKHTQLTHILRDGEEKQFGGKSLVVGPFEVRPLDSYQFRDVDLIKIDVEGAELNVLKGAKDTILAYKPVIVVEQAGNEAKFHGRPLNEASEYLESLGAVRLETFPHNKDRLYHWPE